MLSPELGLLGPGQHQVIGLRLAVVGVAVELAEAVEGSFRGDHGVMLQSADPRYGRLPTMDEAA